VIAQFWPTLNNYIVKIFRGSIQNKIRKKYESFRFEGIDFGCNPPKIDGIKVYNSSSTKDSIIIDFEVFYDGNCDINFSVSGAEIGGLRDFQVNILTDLSALRNVCFS
jgi:Ca2+-dependent lipid-binding protein